VSRIFISHSSEDREQSARLLAWLNSQGFVAGQENGVSSASFSPDGSRVATATGDNMARVWNAADGHLLFTLAGHTDAVQTAAFSSDGKRIVTSSADHTARLWDAGDGRLLDTLAANSGTVFSAAFSPDGSRIVAAGADGTAKIYLVDFDQLLARAKQLVPINYGN
jgi:WD40 repeat protein